MDSSPRTKLLWTPVALQNSPLSTKLQRRALFLPAWARPTEVSLRRSEVTAVARACGLNPRVELEPLLGILADRRLIEKRGAAVYVLGITTRAALTHAADIFLDSKPSTPPDPQKVFHATTPRSSTKSITIRRRTLQPWWPESTNELSGKPGTVHKTNLDGEVKDVRFVKDGAARAVRLLRAATSPEPGDRVVPLSAQMIGLRFRLASELTSRGVSIFPDTSLPLDLPGNEEAGSRWAP